MGWRACLRLTCVALIVWGAGASSASAEIRRVVLLYDERTDLPGLASLDASLVETLTAGFAGSVEIYREEMDLSRFGSQTYLLALRDHLRTKYSDKKIDVAVAVMGPALDFLLSQGEAVFPGTPIVFCGIGTRELESRPLPAHVTGVALRREFSPTLQLALTLQPDAKRVVFVAGTSEFDRRILEKARAELRPYEDRLPFTYLTTLPLDETLAQLSRLPPRTIVLYSTLFQDGAGRHYVPHEVANRVSAAANTPVYGFVDQYLGRGIIGGGASTASRGMASTPQISSSIFSPERNHPHLLPQCSEPLSRCSIGVSCDAGRSRRAGCRPMRSSIFARLPFGACGASTSTM